MDRSTPFALALCTCLIGCSGDDSTATTSSPGDGGGAAGTPGGAGGTGTGGGASGSSGNGGVTSGGAGGASGRQNGGSSGASGGSSGGAGGTMTTDAFWSSFAAALCHRYLHCIDNDDVGSRRRLRAFAQTEDACAALLKPAILRRTRIAALNDGVSAGVLEIRGDQAAQCFEQARLCNYPLKNQDPGDILFEDITPCREVFEGHVATGGACDLSEECSGDAMCMTDNAAGNCFGTCAPRKARGAACTVDRECVATGADWPSCENGKCTALSGGTPAQLGESCNKSSDFLTCADDLWCPGAGFNCSQPIAVGATCDPNDPLMKQCAEGSCPVDTCVAFTVHENAGENCGPSDICDPQASLICASGQCAKADSAASACKIASYWFERAICPPPALAANGASCTTADECQSGVCRYPDGCAASLCSGR